MERMLLSSRRDRSHEHELVLVLEHNVFALTCALGLRTVDVFALTFALGLRTVDVFEVTP